MAKFNIGDEVILDEALLKRDGVFYEPDWLYQAIITDIKFIYGIMFYDMTLMEGPSAGRGVLVTEAYNYVLKGLGASQTPAPKRKVFRRA